MQKDVKTQHFCYSRMLGQLTDIDFFISSLPLQATLEQIEKYGHETIVLKISRMCSKHVVLWSPF